MSKSRVAPTKAPKEIPVTVPLSEIRISWPIPFEDGQHTVTGDDIERALDILALFRTRKLDEETQTASYEIQRLTHIITLLREYNGDEIDVDADAVLDVLRDNLLRVAARLRVLDETGGKGAIVTIEHGKAGA